MSRELGERQLFWCRQNIPHFKQSEEAAKRVQVSAEETRRANAECPRYEDRNAQ